MFVNATNPLSGSTTSHSLPLRVRQLTGSTNHNFLNVHPLHACPSSSTNHNFLHVKPQQAYLSGTRDHFAYLKLSKKSGILYSKLGYSSSGIYYFTIVTTAIKKCSIFYRQVHNYTTNTTYYSYIFSSILLANKLCYRLYFFIKKSNIYFFLITA